MSSLELKKIGVVIGPQKTAAWDVVRDLLVWCDARDIELKARAIKETAQLMPCERLAELDGQLAEDLDLLVSLGGDGTMLGVSRFIGVRQVPVLGVNFGFLGYLTEFSLDELFSALDGLREGNFFLDRRFMLEAVLTRAGERLSPTLALNDAVVSTGGPVRIIEIECRINQMFVNSFRADGMIIATPTGSTAYSLSAGGPIVHPSMSAILLTPICPHTLSNRPVVVPGDSVVDLLFPRADRELMLTIDGQVPVQLQPDDQVTVTCSRTTFDLIRPTNRNYYEVLRTKLKWGTR
ncbi:MAG: NAD(+)/NADH kinase [Acidobacteriota bacterium]|nr:NAD(+)/NADH kinase [Acidobacteriota bacterium]